MQPHSIVCLWGPDVGWAQSLQTMGPAELGSMGEWIQVCSSTGEGGRKAAASSTGWQKYPTVNRSTRNWQSQFCPHAFGQSKSSDQGQGREVEATLCF